MNQTFTATVAQLAAAMIALEEGPPPRNSQGLYIPFQDGGGVWTIAVGHTKGVNTATPPACDALAHQWFIDDQAPLFALVANLPPLEAAAYVDFAFDCGAAALASVLGGHSVLTHYIHDAKGNIEPGLVTRRDREEFLILLSQQLAKAA